MQVFNQASGGRWWLSGVIWVVLALPAQAQIQRISVDSGGAQANQGSHEASISADGSVVAFRSNASNLVADDTNGTSDIFVNDLSAGVVERVSLADDGSELTSPRYNNHIRTSISDDGKRIAFQNYGLSGFPTCWCAIGPRQARRSCCRSTEARATRRPARSRRCPATASLSPSTARSTFRALCR